MISGIEKMAEYRKETVKNSDLISGIEMMAEYRKETVKNSAKMRMQAIDLNQDEGV